MVIENIKDIFRYSSESFPSDFIQLIDTFKKHHKFNQKTFDLIYDAYLFSKNAHKGQKRKSGKPYFTHCIEHFFLIVNFNQLYIKNK